MLHGFHLSGGKGSVLQVWDETSIILDLDSVNQDDTTRIDEFMEAHNGVDVTWESEPFYSDFSVEQLTEYVGAK